MSSLPSRVAECLTIQLLRQLSWVTLDIAYFIHSSLENIDVYFDQVLFSTKCHRLKWQQPFDVTLNCISSRRCKGLHLKYYLNLKNKSFFDSLVLLKHFD